MAETIARWSRRRGGGRLVSTTSVGGRVVKGSAGMGIRWVAVAIDCEWAGPMARFYEGLLGFEIRDLGPGGRWAQLFDPTGGIHLNIQGEEWYRPPIWPEKPGELTKMFHFEVQVDDLKEAVARAVELGGTEAPWQPSNRDLDRMRVMLDPAGHPLCLFLEGE